MKGLFNKLEFLKIKDVFSEKKIHTVKRMRKQGVEGREIHAKAADEGLLPSAQEVFHE